MLLRSARLGLVFIAALICQRGLAQDLSREAAAARQRLHERQLAESARVLGQLLEKDDWQSSAHYVSILHGMEFNDKLVAPLIARTDTTSTGGHRNLVWHAIAYTRTPSGQRFLEQKRKSGTPQERQLAVACLAAAQLLGLGAQCDLSEQGHVIRVFLVGAERKTTADDMALVAQLPRLESLAAGTLADGAFEPLRGMTTLTGVSFGCYSPYVDEAIRCLRSSKQLAGLNLAGPVTDAAMPDLGAFTALTCLRINGSGVTDKGLPHLKQLQALAILDLGQTAVTDAGLKHLAGLTEINHLTLAGTAVTGAGLPHLQNLHKLWALDLSESQIGDRELGNFAEFAALRNIKFLYLHKTNITDAGLASLAAMTTAQGFSLDGNEQITSAGLARLGALQDLHWVTCVGGRLSHAAAEQFALGRPASFYISYTTSPKSPIRHEKGHQHAVDTPLTELVKKLRRPGASGSLSQAVVDEIAAAGPKIIPLLLEAVKQNHGSYQDVARIFHKLGPDVLLTLVDLLRRDDDYRVRQSVTYTLELHGLPLMPKLRRWLSDDSSNVRQAAADAMHSVTSVSGVEMPDDLHLDLLRALGDSNVNVRQEVGGMLLRLCDKIAETSPALTKAATTDADVTVRMRAIGALGHCSQDLKPDDPIFRQTVATLSTAAEHDESFYVREVSIHYLELLAPKDDRALRALVRSLSDAVPSVRSKAAQALNNLGHEELTTK